MNFGKFSGVGLLEEQAAGVGRRAAENRRTLPDDAPLCCLKSLGPLNLGMVHAVKLFVGLPEQAACLPELGDTGSKPMLALPFQEEPAHAVKLSLCLLACVCNRLCNAKIRMGKKAPSIHLRRVQEQSHTLGA